MQVVWALSRSCVSLLPFLVCLCTSIEYITVDARFWLSSFYDQGLCSINFTTTRISPRKASSPEVPAHTDKSEYAGCFPGANPPTLKSDMKVRGTLATDLMAFSWFFPLSQKCQPFYLRWLPFYRLPLNLSLPLFSRRYGTPTAALWAKHGI